MRQLGLTQRRAGTGPRNVTTARDDRHLVRITVTDRTASSTVLSRRWSTATGLDLSASTVRRRLLRAGLVSRMPLRRLPLSRDHERLRLQWARERRHWRAEWRNVVFSGECRFNKSYNDGRIRVRRYAGERNLRARSCLLRIEGNKNSNRYIREILQAEVLPSFRQLHMPYFSRTMPGYMARILQAFFQRRRVSLLPWRAHSSDMSPMEHVRDMVGRLLIHQSPPAPTLDALWSRIQTAWRNIPQEDIQGLFDSMPRQIETLCSALRLHTTLKSHAHRPCTVL